MKVYPKVPAARGAVIRSREIACSTVGVVNAGFRVGLFPHYVSIYVQCSSGAGQLSLSHSG